MATMMQSQTSSCRETLRNFGDVTLAFTTVSDPLPDGSLSMTDIVEAPGEAGVRVEITISARVVKDA
jgi:hypothetical protein